MNKILKFVVFTCLISFLFGLLESDAGKIDWKIQNLGEIQDLYFFENKRFVILKENPAVFGVLFNGKFHKNSSIYHKIRPNRIFKEDSRQNS